MTALFLPRGIRNNNPGNIRLSPTKWQGQKPQQEDASFVEFSDPLFGLRALMKLFATYAAKYGLDTVASLINRFAPPHENATDSYIRHVARALGVRREDEINVSDPAVLIRLARAIVLHENGAAPNGMPAGWYDDVLYQRAAALALSSQTFPVTKGNYA